MKWTDLVVDGEGGEVEEGVLKQADFVEWGVGVGLLVEVDLDGGQVFGQGHHVTAQIQLVKTAESDDGHILQIFILNLPGDRQHFYHNSLCSFYMEGSFSILQKSNMHKMASSYGCYIHFMYYSYIFVIFNIAAVNGRKVV